MISSVLVLAALAGFSDRDTNAAFMYVQAYSTPAVFDVCKQRMPERAGDYDRAFSRWEQRSKGLLTRGKTVVAMQAEHDGFKVEDRLESKRAEAVKKLTDKPETEQNKYCESLLKTMQSG